MPMLRLQQEKKPARPRKFKMFGHLGHLGHLTPKPQQNRPFFNLSNMANPKTLAILPVAPTSSSQLLSPAATAAITLPHTPPITHQAELPMEGSSAQRSQASFRLTAGPQTARDH